MNVTRIISLLATLVAMLTAAASAPAGAPRTLVVDRDGVQCGNADFTSIQAAVDAALPGDLIRVCPDLYPERVVVDKPLTLKADPDAVEAIDCFQPTLAELPLDHQAIVDPAGNGFSVAFKLEADDVALEGFVVQGASVGVDASDSFSGYRIDHNLIRLNTLFGIDFGSAGARESRVDHNCIRENRWGLVSELDDDSLWAFPVVGDERGSWNARDLVGARIDHNSTFRNNAGVEAAGPGRHDDVTFDHNLSRSDVIGIAIQNSRGSRIVDNDLRPTRNGILIGGATEGLEVARNVVETGQQGIVFVPATAFIDVFPAPVTDALVTANIVTAQTLDAILAVAGRLHGSVLESNVTSGNIRDGIRLGLGNSGNVVRTNVAEANGRYGMYAQGAVGNLFEANRMLANSVFDARDDARASNTWLANECVTDFPAGSICTGA
jgi:nitrous oxidase accessory protein NosD